MRRIRRAPTTQLARAGERTIILTGDKPVDEIQFRATTLSGQPAGRVEIDVGEALPRAAELGENNLLDARGLKSLAVIPREDTAITFVPTRRDSNPLALIGGAAFVALAIGFTVYDTLLG